MWDTTRVSLSSFLRSTAALGAWGWMALIVATPALADRASGDHLGMRIATVAYLTGSFICHQRPERTFHVDGIALPVCARCTGVYAGAAAGVVVALWPGFARRARRAPASRWRPALTACAAPMAVSFLVEWLTPLPVSNLARAATGVIAGAAVASFVIAVPLQDLR